MTTITETTETNSSPARRSLTLLAYAVLFLAVTSGAFPLCTALYDRHLVITRQYNLLRAVTGYSSLLQLIFSSVQLLIVLGFFYPLNQTFGHPLVSTKRVLHREVFWGFLFGFLALVLVFPTFLVGSQDPTSTARFLLDNFGKGSDVLVLVLAIVVLPALSELFFRGILLRRLMENISNASALIVSSLLFMLWWPIGGFIASCTLGLAGGLVFYWRKSVLACVATNFLFTIGLIALQIWRL